jgi:hypothetical protein
LFCNSCPMQFIRFWGLCFVQPQLRRLEHPHIKLFFKQVKVQVLKVGMGQIDDAMSE